MRILKEGDFKYLSYVSLLPNVVEALAAEARKSDAIKETHALVSIGFSRVQAALKYDPTTDTLTVSGTF